MTELAAPIIRELDREGCIEILARNHVGRVAWTEHNHVNIQPLHYVYHDEWIYGRTSPGAKVSETGSSWMPVAFEVDEVEGLFQWRSVVVRGGFYVMEHDSLEVHQREWARGVEQLRTLLPEAMTANDPVAFRTVLFRMAVQEMTGREAVPG